MSGNDRASYTKSYTSPPQCFAQWVEQWQSGSVVEQGVEDWLSLQRQETVLAQFVGTERELSFVRFHMHCECSSKREVRG
jgi:hypothetical protein